MGTVSYSPSIVTMAFASYSDLFVENRDFLKPHLYLAPPQWLTPSEFREGVLMLVKLEWLGYRMVKKNYDAMLSRFHLIPERYGRTDLLYHIARQYADVR